MAPPAGMVIFVPLEIWIAPPPLPPPPYAVAPPQQPPRSRTSVGSPVADPPLTADATSRIPAPFAPAVPKPPPPPPGTSMSAPAAIDDSPEQGSKPDVMHDADS